MSSAFAVDQHVGQIHKNATSLIVGRLTRFDTIALADFRIFVERIGKENLPTKSGFAIERKRLLQLRKLLDDVIAACPEGTFMDDCEEEE